jgi:hypothetical protein
MVILAVSSYVIPCKERTCTRTTTGKGLTCSMTPGPELRTQPDLSGPEGSGVCADQRTDVHVRIPLLDSSLILITAVGSFHLDTTPAVRRERQCNKRRSWGRRSGVRARALRPARARAATSRDVCFRCKQTVPSLDTSLESNPPLQTS